MVTDSLAKDYPGSGAGGGGRDLVFLSYSHTDAVWAQRLALLLKPVVATGRLSLWIDTDLRAGQVWQGGIDAAIAESRVALVLVSAAYLSSEFIMTRELPALVHQRVRLLPVLVGDCLWRHVPPLAQVQWLHDPGREGPLDAVGRAGRRNQRLREICDRLLIEVPPVTVSVETAVSARVGAPGDLTASVEPVAESAAGRLVGVPRLPPGYVARRELGELIAAVTATTGGGVVGVTGEVSPLGLHGQGGIGKSVLAVALARDEDIRYRFPEGIFWVTVGEHADLLGVQLDLLYRLGVGGRVPSTVTEATERLRDVLAARRVLLVVDDVWTATAAVALRVTGPRGRLVYTSRDPAVIDAIGGTPYRVDVLSAEAARVVAAGVLDQPVAGLPPVADRVFERVGRVALAVALVAAAVRGGHRTWADIDTDLDAGEEAFGQHPYANAFKAMQIATATLPDELYRALVGMAVFPPDTPVPVAAIARYWAHASGRAPTDTAVDVERLAAAGVLQHQDGHVSFHDLQYDYLLLHAPPPSELHAALVDAYRVLLPASGQAAIGGSGWWRLPLGELYIGDHLAEHLRGAGLHAELWATVTDPAYLARRVAGAGVHAAEADLAQAGAVYPADTAVAWWRGWLARHAHLLAPVREADYVGSDPGVVATFAAWLRVGNIGHEHNIGPDRLGPLLPVPCPRLRWGLAPPPTALIRVLTGHSGGVLAVGWSPDGSWLISGGDDETVRVWEAGSGRLVHILTGHTGRVLAVGWSPDGAWLVSGGDDGMVRVWEAWSGRLVHILTGHSGGVWAVGWSPDGAWLVSGGDDWMVRVWQAWSGRLMQVLTGHTGGVRAVGWSPDGAWLASGSYDGTVHVWSRGKLMHTLIRHTGGVLAVGWSPDGTWLVSGGDDKTVRVWEPRSRRLVHTLTGHTGAVRAVGWSPAGSPLVSGSHDRSIRTWHPAPPQYDATVDGHPGRVWAVGWSPDGALLVSGGEDGTVRVWEAGSGRLVNTLTGHTGGVWAVGWSPDGALLVSGGDDGTVRVWDATSGRLRRTLPRRVIGTLARRLINKTSGRTHSVLAVCWSPDGARLVSGGDDKTVRVSEAGSGRLARTLSGHTDWVRAVGWSPDGGWVVSGGDDKTVRVWEAWSGRLVYTLSGHTDWVRAVGWSPDGAWLVSGGDDKTVRVWEAGSGRLVRTLTGHTDRVTAVAWSPTGAQLVSVGDNGRLVLWSSPELSIQLDELAAVSWTPAGIVVGGVNGVAVFDLR